VFEREREREREIEDFAELLSVGREDHSSIFIVFILFF